MKYLCLTLLLLFSCTLEAISWNIEDEKGFSASATLSTTDLSLTELLAIDLTLTHPSSYRINTEILKSNLLSHSPMKAAPFTLSSSTHSRKISDDSTIETIHYVLQPQLAGEFPVTFLNIQFVPQDADKKPVELFSDLTMVNVSLPITEYKLPPLTWRSLLPLEPTAPIQISSENLDHLQSEKRLQKEAARNQRIAHEKAFPWIELISILLVGLLLVLATLAPADKLMPAETPEERMRRIRTQALQSLQQLQEQCSSTSQFYVKLTDTVRKYISDRYRLPALTCTTPEFLEELKQHPLFSTTVDAKFIQFLQSTDNVKFAKTEPSTTDCQHAKQLAETLILTDSNEIL